MRRGRPSALARLIFARSDDSAVESMQERLKIIFRFSKGRSEGQKGRQGERTMKSTWRAYLRSRGDRLHSDLRNVSEAEGKLVAAEFAAAIARKGVRGAAWVQAIADLRTVLYDNGCLLGAELLTSSTGNPLMGLAKKGQQKEGPEVARERISQAARKQALPIIKVMFESLFAMLWNPGDWSDIWFIDRCGAYGAIALGSNHGMRVSNLLRGDWITDVNGEKVRNPHYLRKSDTAWGLIGNSPDDELVLVKGGKAADLRAAVGVFVRRPLRVEDVESKVVELYFGSKTSKTTSTTADRGLAAGTLLRLLGSRNPEEKRHLVCLYIWAANADPEDLDDCFFFRSYPRSKFIKKKTVVDGLRESAVAVGLNPRNFMAKSMRTTYASHAAAAGVPLAETNRMAGLVPTSTMAVSTYNMGAAGLTTALLMDVAPLSESLLRARSLLGK